MSTNFFTLPVSKIVFKKKAIAKLSLTDAQKKAVRGGGDETNHTSRELGYNVQGECTIRTHTRPGF